MSISTSNNFRSIIIVPCYNEEKNIIKTVEEIKETGFDYIVINDGSTDSTGEILKREKIPYINLSNNLGIGGAMQTGYKYAKENDYDIAVQFDGDGQHNAKEIMKLIAPIIDGTADMTIGSRYLYEDDSDGGYKSTKLRRMGINLLSVSMKTLLGANLKDLTSGFRAVNRKLIIKFSNNYPYEYPEPVTDFETYMKGYNIKEVSVIMNERVHGKSSITALKSVYYMANVLLQFFVLKFMNRGEKNAE